MNNIFILYNIVLFLSIIYIEIIQLDQTILHMFLEAVYWFFLPSCIGPTIEIILNLSPGIWYIDVSSISPVVSVLSGDEHITEIVTHPRYCYKTFN